MKKSKWLALAGVSLLSVGVLVACSSKSNTSSNTYNYVYTADPETLDYLISNKGSTTDAVTNGDRKSTRLNSSHLKLSRMPSSA